MASVGLERAFDRVAAIARSLDLPELGIGTSYGTPALLAGKKSFARMKDADTLVLLLPMADKELLM